jgi:hypothetical protein
MVSSVAPVSLLVTIFLFTVTAEGRAFEPRRSRHRPEIDGFMVSGKSDKSFNRTDDGAGAIRTFFVFPSAHSRMEEEGAERLAARPSRLP